MQNVMIVAKCIIKAPVTEDATIADVTKALAVKWYECFKNICVIKMTTLHSRSAHRRYQSYVVEAERRFATLLWLEKPTVMEPYG